MRIPPFAALLGAVGLVGCETDLPVAAPSRPAAAGLTSDALQALRELPVREAAPRDGYDRDAFGARWSDIDRNGCDQRNDVLSRDLRDVVYRPGTRDCVVTEGTLLDPYTGTEIDFVRGNRTSSQVQIDHVVALSNAWTTGAQRLDPAERRQLANDPLNLLAVDGHSNQSKGDRDASEWLPPDPDAHCDYAERQVAVKAKYGLWVTRPERHALERVLASCAGARPTDVLAPGLTPR
ncbi:MAG: HNH endonuclease family protein [Myxococcota bacterium]